jgi:hypothetical protein
MRSLALLESIPRNLLNLRRRLPHIWESSRVFVSDAVPASRTRLRVQMQLRHEMVDLGPGAWCRRWFWG